MRFLVAPWGNYKGWKEVEYRVLTDDGENSLISRTSLALLQKVLKPDETFIIVSDTLYENVVQKTPESYDEILNIVETETQKFLKEQGINAKVFVLPGVWKKRFSFEGAITDLYYLALKIFVENVESMMERILGSDKKVEIILDLTHGVNFMPVMIYEALKQIGAVLALVNEVELMTFNAEPWVEGVSFLQVYKVRTEKLKPTFTYHLLSKGYKILSPYEILNKNEKSEIGYLISESLKKLDTLLKIDLDAFMLSVISNFPLGVFSFFPDTKILENLIKTIFETHRSLIEVAEERVLRKLKFSEGFESILKLKLISRLLSNLGVCRKYEVELDQIEKIISTIGKDHARRILALNEVSNIRRKLKDKSLVNDWINLSEIFGEDAHSVREAFRDKRIFIAHAGLEMSSVEINPASEKLRYKSEKIEDIERTIINTGDWD